MSIGVTGSLVLIFLILIVLVIVVATKNSKKPDAKYEESEVVKYASQALTPQKENHPMSLEARYDIIPSKLYRYGNRLSFAADNTNQRVYFYTEKSCTAIPYKEIVDFKIYWNSFGETVKSGGVSRAVVGGLLAGGAGAVVGAATAKSVNIERVLSCSLVIFRNSTSYAKTTLHLISQETTDQREIAECRAFADRLESDLRSIIIQCEAIKKKSNPQPIPANTGSTTEDVHEKLKKLKMMYEDDLITEEEYAEKRKAILDKM